MSDSTPALQSVNANEELQRRSRGERGAIYQDIVGRTRLTAVLRAT
jgi:hypothetical protein